MKMIKRVAALLAIGTLTVAAFAGCTKQSGSKADKFYIGGIGPVTGGAAVYGNAVKNGAQIAVDEINAAGGINGYEIEFKFEDDQADGESAINAYNTLKDWGMQILMGTVTSGACESVVSLTGDDNMFQITPSASAQNLIEGDNVFQVCFTDPNQGIASAKYIGEHKLAEKVAIIYDSSDIYSSGIYEKFAAEAKNQNFEIVETQYFTKDTKTDFSVQVQACKDSGADLLFLPIYYTEASMILTEADEIGFDATIFSCDGLDGILTVKGFDQKLAEGAMLLTPFSADSTDEKTANFVKTYKEKFNEVPNQFAADAYDAIYIIKAAIENANATPKQSISELGTALSESMPKITVDGITGEGMTWSATGEVNKAPKAVVIKDAAYVSAE
ncbi:MAG: ABC transporter substrate-binding protein [Butyrivibrio sp.]